MKTSKELVERLQTDMDFAKKFKTAVKQEEGTKDTFDAVISAAADLDYEVTREELEAAAASEEMSEEELGKLAGGVEARISVVFRSVNCDDDDE